MSYSREEIAAAFDRYKTAADHAGATGDWRPWVECFTPDVHYFEHNYGTFDGREAVYQWITETMSAWPVREMREFTWDWATIDTEGGWVIGQLQNRFSDPGDGKVYEEPNWTRVVYGGDGLFKEQEDVYNPARMETMVGAWLAAWQAHHPEAPNG